MTTCSLSIQRSALQLITRNARHTSNSTTYRCLRTVACRSSLSFGTSGPSPLATRQSGNISFTHATRQSSINIANQKRGLSKSCSHLAQAPKPENDLANTSKTVVEQTADLRKTIQKKLTQNLTHENIYNVPNALTFSRLILTPVIGYLVLHDQYAWAVGLFVYAGTTDLVDGWIARKWKLQTVVGSVIDPMADKLLMTVLTVCLALKGALPMYIATLILGRDVSLAIAAIYYRWASLPAPRTLARYWDFSLPSAEVHPTTISKYNTALQLLLIGATTAMPLIDGGAFVSGVKIDDALTAAQWLVAGTTVWSGASYLYTRNAVKILGEKSEGEKKQILRRGRRVIAASFAGCLGLALYLES